MAYHPLTSDSAQTPERRAEEARDLCRMLADFTESMRMNEREFVEKMTDDLDSIVSLGCSVKQLYYLRDLKGRYVDGL